MEVGRREGPVFYRYYSPSSCDKSPRLILPMGSATRAASLASSAEGGPGKININRRSESQAEGGNGSEESSAGCVLWGR